MTCKLTSSIWRSLLSSTLAWEALCWISYRIRIAIQCIDPARNWVSWVLWMKLRINLFAFDEFDENSDRCLFKSTESRSSGSEMRCLGFQQLFTVLSSGSEMYLTAVMSPRPFKSEALNVTELQHIPAPVPTYLMLTNSIIFLYVTFLYHTSLIKINVATCAGYIDLLTHRIRALFAWS